MNRVVSRLLGVVVVLGGGAAAAHFGGQSYVRGQIETAIGQLQRAGVEITYASIDISGAVVPERGAVTEVNVYIPAIRWRFSLPEADSALSLDELDRFAFSLPDEVAIDITDAEGATTGRRLLVSGSDLEAVLTATEENVYDFAISAERAEIVQEGGPSAGEEKLTLEELSAAGRVEVDQTANTATAAISFDLAGLRFDQPSPFAGSPATEAFEMYDLRGRAGLDATSFQFSAAVGSSSVSPMLLIGAPDGEVTLERLEFSLEVSAREALDVSSLLDGPGGLNFFQSMTEVGVETVLAGGRMDQDFKIGLLRVTASAGADQGTPFESLELSEVGYQIDLGPEIMGLTISAGGVRVEGGPTDLFAEYEDVEFVIALNAGSNGFDFPALATVGERDPDAAIAEVIRQFEEGGDAVVSLANGPTAFRERAPADPGVAALIGATSGPGLIEFRLDRERFRAALKSEDTVFQLAGELGGDVSIGGFNLELEWPVAASEELQTAPFLLEITDVTLGPNIWAQVDPAGDLDHAINRIAANIEFGLFVPIGLFENPELFIAGPTPARVDFKEVTLDLAGMTATMTGGGDPGVGAPPDSVNAAVTIRVEGWRKLLDTLILSPLLRNGDAAADLLMLEGVIVEYGAPGDAPGETVFEIVVENGRAAVNGAPVDEPPLPEPEPTPQPEPEPTPQPEPEPTPRPEPEPAPEPEPEPTPPPEPDGGDQ